MRIDSQFVRLHLLDEPKTLLFEINGSNFDLVKQSKKDTSFFYFTTRPTENKAMLENSEIAPNAETGKSGYVCHVFHATCTKTADKAHRLIRQFVEENNDVKPKTTFFSLVNAPTYGAAAALSIAKSNNNEKTSSICHPLQKSDTLSVPASKCEEKASKPPCPSTIDLLLCIDEPSNFDSTTSAVSMFDHMPPSFTNNNKSPFMTKSDVDLFGDHLFQPTPTTNANSFAKQHLNYSMQMGNGVGVQQQNTPVNTFIGNSGNSNGLAPSSITGWHEIPAQQQVPMNPFSLSQPMAPMAPPMNSAPLKPVFNPFASMTTPTASKSMNPFTASTGMAPKSIPAYPQYVNISVPNPLMAPSNSASQQTSQNMSFGSEFDNFLSQTVKGQFNSGNNKSGNLF